MTGTYFTDPSRAMAVLLDRLAEDRLIDRPLRSRPAAEITRDVERERRRHPLTRRAG